MPAARYAEVLERYLSDTEAQLAACVRAVSDSREAIATCEAAEQQVQPSLEAARSAVGAYRGARPALRRYHDTWLEVMRRLAGSAAVGARGDLEGSRLKADFERLEKLAGALRPKP